MGTLSFIIGGIFTLAVFIAGVVIGTMISSKNLEEKIKEVKHKIVPPPPTSGGVKAITPDEIKKEEKKGFVNRMQDLIS